jgi:hypothetical protein
MQHICVTTFFIMKLLRYLFIVTIVFAFSYNTKAQTAAETMEWLNAKALTSSKVPAKFTDADIEFFSGESYAFKFAWNSLKDIKQKDKTIILAGSKAWTKIAAEPKAGTSEFLFDTKDECDRFFKALMHMVQLKGVKLVKDIF